MAETRTERTTYMGLLALMVAAADSQGWAYPYWNTKALDAALYALAQAPRTGVAPLLAPSAAPTLELLESGGVIPGGQTIEIAQTFVDEFGRETDAGTIGAIATGSSLADPDTAPTLGTPSEEGSGYAGGALVVVFTWVDGNNGETLASPAASTVLPYLPAGLYSQVEVTLPSTPAAAGAAGANLYIQHRGGNVVLAKRITDEDEDTVTLDGTTADCYLTPPYVNSTSATKSIEITGQTDPGAVLTRFYVRKQGEDWVTADRRLLVAGATEWDAGTVSYPLTYTGGTLAPGYPPTVSQVKEIRPVDLSTEAYGTLPDDLLPDEAVTEAELILTTGEAVISGLAVTAQGTPDMTVHVAAGVALQAGGRRTPTATDLTIPVHDDTNHRIDIICLMDDGVIEGPTENAALKGTPAGSPVAPSTPSGALKLAEINVGEGATTIVTGNITDSRWLIPTLVTAVLEFRSADSVIAGDLSDHAADDELHASKAYTITDEEFTCDGSTTADFTITCPDGMLVTRIKVVVTSGGIIDYKLELFSNAGRTVLEYQAGGDVGDGISEGSFEDRIPWEWFGGAAIYGRITNNSADNLTAIAVGVKYRL